MDINKPSTYLKAENMTGAQLQEEIDRLEQLGNDNLTSHDAYRLRECKDYRRAIRDAMRSV